MLCVLVSWLRPAEPLIIIQDDGDTSQISPTAWDKTIEQRRVYPMSVVPGGVYSAAEVERAVSADRVVAVHYAGLNVAKLGRTLLAEPVLRYVSFRRGSKVYWTRRAMPIPAGEAVLADGDSMVRSRCGNMLSESPKDPVLPVTERQPTAAELETPVSLETAPPLLAVYAAPDAHGESGIASSMVAAAGPDQVSPATTPPGISSGIGQQKSAPSSSLPGFGGLNALNGGTGSGLLAPSQNPAIYGPEGVVPVNPDAGVPLPPQLRLELSTALPSNMPSVSETVLAVLSPGIESAPGTTGGISMALPVTDSSDILVIIPTVSNRSAGGSRGQVTLYNPYGQVSSSGAASGGSVVTAGGNTPSTSNISVPALVLSDTNSREPEGNVPEPGSLLLLATGMVTAVGGRRVYRLLARKQG